MDRARLEELKQLVTDGLLIDWSQGLDCDWYKHIEDEDKADLLTVLDEAIDRVDKESLTTDLSGKTRQLPSTDSTDDSTRATGDNTRVTNFERWKSGLTIEKLLPLLNYSCMNCPLFEKCVSVNFRMSKSCRDLIKEWGEQYV